MLVGEDRVLLTSMSRNYKIMDELRKEFATLRTEIWVNRQSLEM